jgi:Transposase, Mutator family
MYHRSCTAFWRVAQFWVSPICQQVQRPSLHESTGSAAELTGSALALPPDAGLATVAERLVEQARADGVALTGSGGLLTDLIQRVLQGALETEITDHLGYEPHAAEGRGTGNSRNGHYPKTV